MPKGLTIADFVQQVLYAQYKVRLDVNESLEDSFHCHSDKFKEVVMEANLVLQEFQKEQDWQFLRDRWEIGIANNPRHGIQEFEIPDDVYKVCTGYNDAVRLHHPHHRLAIEQIPFEEARSGNRRSVEMFDEWGRANIDKWEQRAFTVGNVLTFNRPWTRPEQGCLIETDVIRYIEPLHICGPECPNHCPKAYDELILEWLPDPLYIIYKTAAYRAEGDPSCSEMVSLLTDKATKMLSAMRENDSAHTTTDTYDTCILGYIPVL